MPESSVKGIHEAGAPGNNANRHAATDHFPIGRKVGLYAVIGLGASGCHTETGYHLIENQHNSSLSSYLTKFFYEFAWLELRQATLNGFHQYCRYLILALHNDIKRLLCSVF